MNRAIDRRVKVLEETMAPPPTQRTILIWEGADGTVTCLNGDEPPKPEEDCLVISLAGVAAIDGSPATEDELEAMYPGRRARIAQREQEEGR